MSDETTQDSESAETQTDPNSVDPSPEPRQEPVDLGKEAAKAAAEEIRSLNELRNSLPAEQRELLDKEMQSNSNRAVNEAKKAWEARQQEAAQKGEVITADVLEAKLAERDAIAQREREAYDKLYRNLGSQGVVPGSEEYDSVIALYEEMKAETDLSPKFLLSEKGVKMLVQAAIGDQKAEAPEPGYGYKERPAPAAKPDPNYQPGDVQWQLKEDMRKAMMDG